MRETRTIRGNFKTSFLRNQNESEAGNGGPDVSDHGEIFFFFLDPLDFLHIGNIFPPLAAHARNAHEPVIGKNVQVNQAQKRNISTTKTDRKARVRAPDVSKHFTFI